MKIFLHNDKGYVAWLKDNPTGYVLNCRKRPQYTLHRATCILINKPLRDGAEWTSLYKKICAVDRASIEKYIKSKPKYCPMCLPSLFLPFKPPYTAEDWIKKDDRLFIFVHSTVKLYRVDGKDERVEITDLDEVAHVLAWGHGISKENAKRTLKN